MRNRLAMGTPSFPYFFDASMAGLEFITTGKWPYACHHLFHLKRLAEPLNCWRSFCSYNLGQSCGASEAGASNLWFLRSFPMVFPIKLRSRSLFGVCMGMPDSWTIYLQWWRGENHTSGETSRMTIFWYAWICARWYRTTTGIGLSTGVHCLLPTWPTWLLAATWGPRQSPAWLRANADAASVGSGSSLQGSSSDGTWQRH